MTVACTPAQSGTPRWVDDRTWVFDFAVDLPPGTRCDVKPKAGVKSIAGQAIDASAAFAFATGDPAVVRAYPQPGEWQKIEEEQVFAPLPNGPATPRASSAMPPGWEVNSESRCNRPHRH